MKRVWPGLLIVAVVLVGLLSLAWAVLAPCGILAARFLKLWPGQDWPDRLDHPGWWQMRGKLR